MTPLTKTLRALFAPINQAFRSSRRWATGWGRSGWVTIELGMRWRPRVDLLKVWIDESYRAVAPKTLVVGLSR